MGDGPPAADAAGPIDERTALARLEDLGDALATHHERQSEREQAARDEAEGQRAATDQTGGGTTRADPAGPATVSRATLVSSNVVVAGGTLLSRLTGLARVVVFAAVIGKGALADAYLIGNETPNIVYELLIGGVLSATLVPLFTSFLGHDDRAGGERATNAVITVTLAALAALTALAVLAAPVIFRLYTFNTEGAVDPELFRRAGTQLTRIFLLQIFFYGTAGLFNALLNSRRRFFAAAWSPILANVIVIVTLLTLPRQAWAVTDVLTNDRLRLTLGLGTTAGIAAMALVLIPAARRTGWRFHAVFEPRHPAVRRLATMSAWTLGYVVANQVVVTVVRNLSGPGSGDSAAYLNAYIFFVLPHGLLAVSIATTFQPELARAVGRRDRESFCAQASLGVRLIALLTLPAGIALFVLRRPLIGLFLERGEFSALDGLITSRALAGFAVGLFGFSIYLFTLRGFYAHQDTRTPFVVNCGQCLLNIAFAFAFVGRWGVLGLGAAFALSYVIAAVWALQVLSYKVPGFPLRSVLASVTRIALAAVLGGEAAWLVADHVGANTGVQAAARLLAGAAAGLAVYVAALAALRVPELRTLTRRR